MVDWLRRTVREREINHILAEYWTLPPQEFIRACFHDWDVSYSIQGLDRLDPKGRYLFVANHPFGGMDGMMLADKLIDRFGDVRVVVNDLLMHVEPLRPLWLPVNKHGSQNADYARRMEEAFFGDVPILTFPAGLCSRRIDGRVADTQWKTNFLKKVYASQRQVVPLFVEGRLSNFFYRLDRCRKALGVKFNIEMLWLPDEMFSQAGKHFRMVAGEPIAVSKLQSLGSLREQTEYIRKKTYFLEKTLAPSPDPVKKKYLCDDMQTELRQESLAAPVDRAALKAELTPDRKVRDTNKAANEIYVFAAADCPALMREVGRLREEAFRCAGGGTGCEVDIDAEDLAEDGYFQLIVWDPAAEEIVGGYRFIVCTTEYPAHLSTEHYFRFSDRFRRKYLPRTMNWAVRSCSMPIRHGKIPRASMRSTICGTGSERWWCSIRKPNTSSAR